MKKKTKHINNQMPSNNIAVALARSDNEEVQKKSTSCAHKGRRRIVIEMKNEREKNSNRVIIIISL